MLLSRDSSSLVETVSTLLVRELMEVSTEFVKYLIRGQMHALLLAQTMVFFPAVSILVFGTIILLVTYS